MWLIESHMVFTECQVFTVEYVSCVATQLLQQTQGRDRDCETAGRERRRLGLLISVQLGFRTS